MAEMIPDRMPAGASRGEKRLFDILQDLPEDCVVYYEPIVADRYPDFIVILPELGLLVIEVKGWYPKEIVQADNEKVILDSRGHQNSRKHPLRQARDYMYRLMDTCRENPDFRMLVNENGPHRGRFVFPFGYFAILSNITSEQLRTRGLTTVFPPARVATRDVVQSWMDLDQNDLIQTVKAFFNPFLGIPEDGSGASQRATRYYSPRNSAQNATGSRTPSGRRYIPTGSHPCPGPSTRAPRSGARQRASDPVRRSRFRKDSPFACSCQAFVGTGGGKPRFSALL
ncbi:MAG: nuclease-related domain-containing protein [Planctomycetota bacterium]